VHPESLVIGSRRRRTRGVANDTESLRQAEGVCLIQRTAESPPMSAAASEVVLTDVLRGYRSEPPILR